MDRAENEQWLVVEDAASHELIVGGPARPRQQSLREQVGASIEPSILPSERRVRVEERRPVQGGSRQLGALVDVVDREVDAAGEPTEEPYPGHALAEREPALRAVVVDQVDEIGGAERRSHLGKVLRLRLVGPDPRQLPRIAHLAERHGVTARESGQRVVLIDADAERLAEHQAVGDRPTVRRIEELEAAVFDERTDGAGVVEELRDPQRLTVVREILAEQLVLVEA